MACAIVFLIFTFCYLYFYQADILAVEQHLLSGGKTYYVPWIGALLITFVLYLIHLGTYGLTVLYKRAHALTYFPSLLILTILTGMKISDAGCTMGHWLFTGPFLLVIYVFVVIMLKKYQPYEQPMNDIGPFSRMMWVNLLTMAVMFLLVGACSNRDALFHSKMRVETLLKNGEYEKALEVGRRARRTDASLFQLRAYALARTNGLGSHLFEYPTVSGSNALLPRQGASSTVMFPEMEIRRFASTKAADDYRLCAYLLDKDLLSFAKSVYKCYDIKSADFPKHYREALTLYTHLRSHPSMVYHHAVMDEDYDNMKQLERNCHSATERHLKVMEQFGNTYWYYYNYVWRSRKSE
jgi:hypothetical protein